MFFPHVYDFTYIDDKAFTITLFRSLPLGSASKTGSGKWGVVNLPALHGKTPLLEQGVAKFRKTDRKAASPHLVRCPS